MGKRIGNMNYSGDMNFQDLQKSGSGARVRVQKRMGVGKILEINN